MELSPLAVDADSLRTPVSRLATPFKIAIPGDRDINFPAIVPNPDETLAATDFRPFIAVEIAVDIVLNA
ncbi:MAG: hypothetical protein LUD69_07325 [Oscillospiraceae bacterium]|nr:hypothetical protein [Oscillospiraceae bacterium]